MLFVGVFHTQKNAYIQHYGCSGQVIQTPLSDVLKSYEIQ